jgi:hypothetical protein
MTDRTTAAAIGRESKPRQTSGTERMDKNEYVSAIHS